MQNPSSPVDPMVLAAAMVRSNLREQHLAHSADPIVGPDDSGRFPDAPCPPRPVVVDANRLYHDLLPACRGDRRGVLVTAANYGGLRLFCERHVIEEVYEHAARWADSGKIDRAVFLGRWTREYLPLLRVVDVPAGLLTAEESGRIEVLRSSELKGFGDPDDVPTATLAIVLSAFLLSEDKAPVRAAYGHGVDLAEREKWLAVLKAGSDAPVLTEFYQGDALIVELVGRAAFLGMGKLWRDVSPLAALALAGGLYLGWRHSSPKVRQTAAGIASVWAVHFMQSSNLARTASQHFADASIAAPSWSGLADAVGPQAALARACLYLLARAETAVSAAEMTERVRGLGVAASEARVRSVLRAAAVEVARGRFQLGVPAAAI